MNDELTFIMISLESNKETILSNYHGMNTCIPQNVELTALKVMALEGTVFR
jgi:hypothetical protein